MRKKYLLLFILLLLFPLGVAWADDNADIDWSDYTKSYDKLQNQQPVTDEQFNKALDTVKGLQKKKKSKNKKKNPNSINPKDIFENAAPVANHSSLQKNQLITVPKDLRFNDIVIHTGFYMLKPLTEGDFSYLLLIQAGQIVAKIPAVKIIPDASDTEVYKAKLEIYPTKAKLIYSDLDNNFEASFKL